MSFGFLCMALACSCHWLFRLRDSASSRWSNLHLSNSISVSGELDLVVTNPPFSSEGPEGKLDPTKVIFAKQVRFFAINNILLGELSKSILSQLTNANDQLFECLLGWLGHGVSIQRRRLTVLLISTSLISRHAIKPHNPQTQPKLTRLSFIDSLMSTSKHK